MLRSATLGTLTALVMTVGGVGVSQAASAATTAAETTGAASWGSTKAPDQVLRKGCRDYRFFYKITTPNNEWQAEMFITDPKRRPIASVLADAGSQPRQGILSFRTCRASTTPGRFKIRMRVTYTEGYEKHVGFVKPSYFRLVSPR
ncbi:hypothetical protein [Nocardioides psychrotolerans]|uniref:hypothetical protein n=1 Tax=Nocardioides psychrotolerans TaxID=1005945 RepID=UPI003137B67A